MLSATSGYRAASGDFWTLHHASLQQDDVRPQPVKALVEVVDVDPGPLVVRPEVQVEEARREEQHGLGRRRKHDRSVARERGEAVEAAQPAGRPRRADLGQRRREDLDSGVGMLRVLVVVDGLDLEQDRRVGAPVLHARDQVLERHDLLAGRLSREELGDAVLRRERGGPGDVGERAREFRRRTQRTGRVIGRRQQVVVEELGEGALRRVGAQRSVGRGRPDGLLRRRVARRGRIAGPLQRRRAHFLHEIILEDLLAAVDALLDLGQAVLDRLVGLADLVVVADPVLGRLAAAARLRGLRCFLRRPYVFGAFAGSRLDRSHAVDATLRELDESLARRPIRLALMAWGMSESSPGILQREAVPKAHLSTRCDCVSISLNFSNLSGVGGGVSLFSRSPLSGGA